MPSLPMPPEDVVAALRRGMVIPAHPLALTAERRLDERRQRALTRYYCAAGAGGIAVAVHTTQFEIREPGFALLEPVLAIARDEATQIARRTGQEPVMIAGVCGNTQQAVHEAEMAANLGYHAGLLSLAAMKQADTRALLEHCHAVSKVIPLFGFYLQPAVGGRLLGYEFWREFAQIENVVGIKMAPFNRYQTIDVMRGVAESGRANEVALYTGNDDHVVLDLLTPFRFQAAGAPVTLRIVGGLLGQWAVWTHGAAGLLARAHEVAATNAAAPQDLLTMANELTDANAAIFDVAHSFAGCISGINEVLRRQGLLAGNWCLSSGEMLSPGQAEEITRVSQAYPWLTDDDFVAEHLDEWLS